MEFLQIPGRARYGKLIDSYSSMTAPDNGALGKDIQRALAQR